jgi:hypothetical protein
MDAQRLSYAMRHCLPRRNQETNTRLRDADETTWTIVPANIRDSGTNSARDEARGGGLAANGTQARRRTPRDRKQHNP